jgi:N-acetylmuramoyl-L-alanine amidase
MSVINESLIKDIAIHCSATKGHQDWTAEDINSWHQKRGWSEIGYHFVIKLDGLIEVGRDLDMPGAHVKGYNKYSWGICLIGGLDENGDSANTFNPAQMESLELVLRFLKRIAPHAKIRGHNEFPGVKKDCPCFSVQGWLPDDLR